ncbi:hypothetical protein ACQRBH_11025 [Bariatricus sp. SGI.161]|uniref:hypothetical protein n=1 Tax=Bariatricus sp. SGI.161 TaxID=3420550 RepID=UPI003CFFBADB
MTYVKYQIMHGERKVASIDTQGRCTVFDQDFMPYNLYLEDGGEELDTFINNLANFYFWCASRVLTLDREYAKELLNSIGATQASTDKERAQVALSYHCLSLTDIYWVKREEEKITFREINLFENHLSNAFVDVALRGRQMTIENSHLIADDLSTNGSFPKAWLRKNNTFWLLKDGGSLAVENEILASKICQCNQVVYSEKLFDGTLVSCSKIMTSLKYSLVSREAFEVFALNQNMNALDYILELDGYSYYMMNILDYLIGNTDRHWGNWGLLVRNSDNQPERLYDLMDFNKAFSAYDRIEGANCLTTDSKKCTQKEAALAAVEKVGLNQVAKVKKEWFSGREEIYERFLERLKLLENHLPK